MTAYSDLDSAVAAFQGGAFEYLPKPFDVDQAVDLVRRALTQAAHQNGASEETSAVPEILGQGAGLQEVFRAIGRLSPVPRHGADQRRIRHRQGTGRARPAPPQPAQGRALHRHQHRRDPARPARIRTLRPRKGRLHRRRPCVAAASNRPRAARCSSTKSATCRPSLQTRLLRVLSDSHFYRVGGHQPVKANVRVIAATHQDLEGRGQGRPVPRRPLPSPQRHPPAPAAAARTA
jgi:two-component system nitrogen regulation response regulator GlnG